MLWVDHESYCGPDRRRKAGGMRIRERRRYICAGAPPPLNTALRQIRMRVLEAQGVGAARLADRANAVATLALHHGESEAAHELSVFAWIALRGRNGDVRPDLYRGLDRIHATLHDAYH